MKLEQQGEEKMEGRKTTLALLIVVILVVGVVATWYFILRPKEEEPWPPAPPFSPFASSVTISEIHYDTTGDDLEEEYVELYVWENLTPDLGGWVLTTFDDDDEILPGITDLDEFDYVVIHMGSGTSDLDASDGVATIYLGRTEPILDNDGDEVALYNGEERIVDYVRYKGGNGGPVYGDWSQTDLGVSANSTSESIQMYGTNQHNSSNWISSRPTEGGPNVIVFSFDEFTIAVYSGFNYPPPPGGKCVPTVVPNATNPANAATINKVKKWVKHCEDFYSDEGFSNPQLGPDIEIDVHVGQEPAGGSTCAWGYTEPNGSIYIAAGTVDSDIDLKYVLEHEMCHMYQFGRYLHPKHGSYDKTCPEAEWFWDEGMAVYFGIESVKEQFNLDNSQVMDEFKRVGDHNWYDNFRDLNTNIFSNWDGSFDAYIGSYLFLKWLAEKYGEGAIMDIYCTIQNFRKTGVDDTTATEATGEVLGKPFSEVVRDFAAWLYQEAPTTNGVPAYGSDEVLVYEGWLVWFEEGIYVEPWGTVVEEIVIESDEPFEIYIDPVWTNPDNRFTGTVKVYDLDGNLVYEQGFVAGPDSVTVSVLDPSLYSRIVILKTRIGEAGDGLIFTDVVPWWAIG